ncbi:MAG: hypothetical protein AAGB48_01890 [Planctomycetota bacterium]
MPRACPTCKSEMVAGMPGFVVGDQEVCRECHDKAHPRCPYCGAELPKLPGARSKCRTCGKMIHVRTSQQIWPSTLLTEEQKVVCDYYRRVHHLGDNTVSFLEVASSLSSSGYGPMDVFWEYARRVELDLAKRKNYDSMRWIAELECLHMMSRGHDASHVLRKYFDIELRVLLDSGSCTMDTTVEIQCGNDACSDTIPLAKRRMTIRQAARHKPLPCEGCVCFDDQPSRFCQCRYEQAWDDFG